MTERNANPDEAIGDFLQTHLNDYSPSAVERRRKQNENARESWLSLNPHSRPRVDLAANLWSETA